MIYIWVSTLCPLYGHLFLFVCCIGQVAEKSKRKTDAVEDTQKRGSPFWGGNYGGFNVDSMGNIGEQIGV